MIRFMFVHNGTGHCSNHSIKKLVTLYGPYREKTCLLGFQESEVHPACSATETS